MKERCKCAEMQVFTYTTVDKNKQPVERTVDPMKAEFVRFHDCAYVAARNRKPANEQ